MDSIRPINAKPDELLGAIEAMRRNLPAMIIHAALVAELKRAYYLALIEQGFSEAQALELAKGNISV